MPNKKTTRKIIIVVAMLLVLGVNTFLFGFIEPATAPNEQSANTSTAVESSGTSSAHTSDSADASQAAVQAESAQTHETAPIVPAPENHFMIRMSPLDIQRGNLLLINHEHSTNLPDERSFVRIANEKTLSYRVTVDDLLLAEAAIAPLNDMMDSFFAETGRNTVAVISAYRDFARQEEILREYIALVGSVEALRWAARPGHSEHHTGLAVDLGMYSNGVLRTFLGTGVYSWFERNSHEYGFILRYPAEKSEITKTAYEPWHYRYIGLPHAQIVHSNGWCLEEYIEILMSHTRSEPFVEVYDDGEYEIYYTADMEIFIPYDSEFDISGNNIDGFIVTIKR